MEITCPKCGNHIMLDFIPVKVPHCLHGGWRGTSEEGHIGQDETGEIVPWDLQCSECKLWFPRSH